MKQRERHSPDGTNGSAAPLPAPSAWELIFRAASPARREELLARARGAGVLYAHHLPDAAAGAGPVETFPAALLNGQSRELPPVRPPAVTPGDDALDCDQREALARALHTPDVCLIGGVAGSGKSRVVAELLSQATARGERVLFLAPGAAALDRVLTSLTRLDSVCTLRCLGPDEDLGRLAPEVRALTFDGRAARFREDTLPRARSAVAESRGRVASEQRKEEVLGRLARLAESRRAAAARASDLDAKLAALIREATADAGSADPAGPLGSGLAAARRERDANVARLDARESSVRAENDKLRAALAEAGSEESKLQVLSWARQGLRFWSAAWWRALVNFHLNDRLQRLRERRFTLEADAALRAEEAAALARERAAEEAKFEASVRRLVDEEVARRGGRELETERAGVAAEEARLAAEWDEVVATLEASARPSGPGREQVAEAATTGARRLAAAVESLAAAERWVVALEEALPHLPAWLTASADVVAAPTAAIASDANVLARAEQFDLLVVEEAERLTESEFLRAARRARRWVLVGQPGPEADVRPAGRSLLPAALRPGFFQHLWQKLHADPSGRRAAWLKLADGRLCCRLRPLAGDDLRRLESECVADRPEIELRILTPPRGEPELAEVVFPAETSAAEAKAYLFRELQELPVHAHGRWLRWGAEPGRCVLWMDQPGRGGASCVEVAPGVTELIGPPAAGEPAPFLTYGIAFDHTAGWTRERAEEWASRSVGLRDSGRTAYLETPHRMRPALGRVVCGLLGERLPDWFEACPVADAGAPAVEFVAVPSPGPDAEPLGRGETEVARGGAVATAARLRVAKGGAGLETELSAPRRPDALPTDLRAVLPAKGLVNYLEARVVVRELELLLEDTDFRSEAERWRGTGAGGAGHAPAVAVIALYAAQAELIRQLAAAVPRPKDCAASFEVGTPECFGQRECLVALVSMTRSHAHRPVSYGEGPRDLALALTRARSRLVLFGDPGTLTRRCQCTGPVEHLDPSSADRERAFVSRLVACLQGERPHHGDFRLRQGSGS